MSEMTKCDEKVHNKQKNGKDLRENERVFSFYC